MKRLMILLSALLLFGCAGSAPSKLTPSMMVKDGGKYPIYAVLTVTGGVVRVGTAKEVARNWSFTKTNPLSKMMTTQHVNFTAVRVEYCDDANNCIIVENWPGLHQTELLTANEPTIPQAPVGTEFTGSWMVDAEGNYFLRINQ